MNIQEVNLNALDLVALEEFYGGLFEMQCTIHEDVLEIHAGNSRLRFNRWSGHDRPYYHFAFNIPSNKAVEAFQYLDKKTPLIFLEGYQSHIADFSNWNAKSIYFLDPAGNIVELIARQDLHDNPVAQFSMDMIRSISEIGIVFPAYEFESGVREILSAHNLAYFPKQKPLPHFKVIGDDQGLLICVPEKRDWYPLKQKPALTFPMQVKIRAEEHVAILIF